MNNENERKDQDRLEQERQQQQQQQSQSSQKQDQDFSSQQRSQQGQSASGQAETSVADPTGSQQTAQGGSPEQNQGPSGFVGSQAQESGEYLQQGTEREAGQAGFAEQGRGAEEGSSPDAIKSDKERSQDRSSDIEGSSSSSSSDR